MFSCSSLPNLASSFEKLYMSEAFQADKSVLCPSLGNVCGCPRPQTAWENKSQREGT